MRDTDFFLALEGVMLPKLARVLQEHENGHCMRVDDIPAPLMMSLCKRLREAAPEHHAYVLAAAGAPLPPSEIAITSTKLVELRNPDSAGVRRRPLLVFVPQEARTAAEDSFASATFEQIALGDSYALLERQILSGMNNGMPGLLTELLARLRESDWPWVTSDNVVRFLLSIKVNGNTPDLIGPSLCELALVPDFRFADTPADAPARMTKNLETVRTLTYSDKSEYSRVLSLGLSDKAFRKSLASFLASQGLDDPASWTHKIAFERSAWRFSFDKWQFTDALTAGSACVLVNDLGLPHIPDDTGDGRIRHLVGQPYLPIGKDGIKKFSVTFEVSPRPDRIPGLHRISAEIVSRESGPTGVVKTRKAGKSGKGTISFTKLGRVALDEGWHYVRLDALTEDGDRIPLTDEEGNPLAWDSDDAGHLVHPNYTVPFFVLPEGEIEEQPPQRAIPCFDSLTHAVLHYRLGGHQDQKVCEVEVGEVDWEQDAGRSSRRGMDRIGASLRRIGKIRIPVSRSLRELEERILADPRGAVSWHLSVKNEVVADPVAAFDNWPELPGIETFMQARRAYFERIAPRGSPLISQGVDWRFTGHVAVDYAETYLSLLDDALLKASSGSDQVRKGAMKALRVLLSIDTVLLTLQTTSRDTREAALVSPTHPLRALWLACWARVGENWADEIANGSGEFALRTRDALLEGLLPTNTPPVVTTAHGRQFTSVENIASCWALYGPPDDNDPRGLIGLVCTALGLTEPSTSGALVTGRYLAKRVERYISQHPYVSELHINAFNPGRAHVLADMLLCLQRMKPLETLRYNIRLFSPAGRQKGLGAALKELVSPTGTVSAKEADAFASVSPHSLFPKLRLATLETGDFKTHGGKYEAHLSFIFDLFPSAEVGADLCDMEFETSPVHGLCQDFHLHYTEDEETKTATWRRMPRHGDARPIAHLPEAASILTRLAGSLSAATAAVATGQAGSNRRPTLALNLRPEDRSLLHQVHEASDWVFIADRNLGIEFFDQGGRRGRPDYVIDHSPDVESSLGHRVIVTSRSLHEIEAMIAPVLNHYGLPSERKHAVAILDQLRSLSGRLALKLLSAPTQKAEAMGLALCRCYLEMQGAFANQIVVPLDAHIDLYAELKRQGEDADDAVSFKRTDLALFDINAVRRQITCNLVEVKCYQSTGDIGAYTALKDHIRGQLTQTESVLQWHFDPDRVRPDRPDRVLKCRQLSTMLRFYLERGIRYGLVDACVAEEARFLLEGLERGYRLRFTRSGIVFDFEKEGTDPVENDAGVEYHRIGVNLVRELIGAAGDLAELRTGTASAAEFAETPMTPSLSTRSLTTLPKLDSAAFLSPPREHTVPTENLGDGYGGVPDLPPWKVVESDDIGEPPAVAESPEGEEETPIGIPDPQRESETEAPEPDQEMFGSQSNRPRPSGSPEADIFLGTTARSPQYGLLGESSGRNVALDLNQTHTISLFGVQGGGKSYTLGTIMEMACLEIPRIGVLPKPLATVVFHYSPTQDYSPEFTSMVKPNDREDEITVLRARYGAGPLALPDVVLLTPRDKLEQRRAEYPDMEVVPLTFSARELDVVHWQFLMGTIGNPSAYVRQMRQIMRKLRSEENLTLETLRCGVADSNMVDHLKDMASMRLDFAAQYVADVQVLTSIIKPGRLVIVDLRDELIEKDEALGLFVVLMQLFSDAKDGDGTFNKLVVFDEAHKYIESADLVTALIQVVREMRHKGTSVLVASQDPPSVPVSLIELSSEIIMHRFNSPAWLRHVQKANAALGALTAEKMANLGPGQAYVWSSKASDDAFTRGAVRIQCRPRATRHGGATKTAV